jgi:chorismate mutase
MSAYNIDVSDVQEIQIQQNRLHCVRPLFCIDARTKQVSVCKIFFNKYIDTLEGIGFDISGIIGISYPT